jgi:Tol biopolymer transport system component
MFRHTGMALALGSIFALGAAMPAWAHGTTERVSVNSGGTQGNNPSGFEQKPAISAGGRFVAFSSAASNLVPGDTNDFEDVFVHDRRTDTTRRVSVSSGGAQGDNFSSDPAISPGGRFVAFLPRASNLVPGDTNNVADIFVRILAP